MKQIQQLAPRNRRIRGKFSLIMRAILLVNLLAVLASIKLVSAEEQATSDRNERNLIKRHTEKDFAPKLMHQPQSAVLPWMKPHSEDCNVESMPEAEIKWFKDDQLLQSQPAHFEQNGKELMFFQMNDEDTGEYHCEATNYLGSVQSERFKLTVQSSIQDPRIRLEPRVAEASADQQVKFTCKIPAPSQQQRSSEAPEVSWKRNGKRLPVKWLDDEDEELSDGQRASRFVARQIGQSEFVLTILRAQLKDDNSTFTCLYRFESQLQPEEAADKDLARESVPARLRVLEQLQPEGAQVKLDVNLAPPIDNLATAKHPHELPAATLTQQQRNNQTTQLNEPRRVNTLRETLADLYEIAKPTLIIFGILFLVSLLVILQLVYIRRKTRQNRYMKHQYSGGSSGSSTQGGHCQTVGGSVVGIDCDPVLSSLMGRTLSAPSAGSLGVGIGASKKYRSYRDHVRKVAAANEMVANDLVDGYFQQQHQQLQQDPHEPFFACSGVLPNLYNQSLAAREQARSLLQASEHMRSLSNLTKQQSSAAVAGLRLSQNGSHLNLPLSFAFGQANAQTQAAAGARQVEHLTQNRLLDGPSQLLAASALWSQQLAAGFATGRGQHQSAAQSARQQADEHYQLVNCSSISPTSSSSVAGSSSSAQTRTLAGDNQQASLALMRGGEQQERDSSSPLNHYSTIENNDDEDARYEEVDHHGQPQARQRIGSDNGQSNLMPAMRTSTFVNSDRDRLEPSSACQTRPNNRGRLVASSSASSTSGCGDSATTTSTSGSSFVADQTRFSKRSNNPTVRQSSKPFDVEQAKQRPQNLSDQLSPYAVSSICGSISQQPPPMSSEAMRALSEQFDINQIMLLDDNDDQQQKPSPAFEPPPPPAEGPNEERGDFL